MFAYLDAVCVSPEYIKINHSPLSLETPYSISPTRFDSGAIEVDSCILRDSMTICHFEEVFNSLHDAIAEVHIPDKPFLLNGRIIGTIQMYPQMNTRGKITMVYSDRNVVWYYDQFKIWNSSEDKLYRMNDSVKILLQCIDDNMVREKNADLLRCCSKTNRTDNEWLDTVPMKELLSKFSMRMDSLCTIENNLPIPHITFKIDTSYVNIDPVIKVENKKEQKK